MPYDYQIWYEETLIRMYGIAGAKGYAGVSQSELWVKLLRNTLWWLLNLAGRTLNKV